MPGEEGGVSKKRKQQPSTEDMVLLLLWMVLLIGAVIMGFFAGRAYEIELDMQEMQEQIMKEQY